MPNVPHIPNILNIQNSPNVFTLTLDRGALPSPLSPGKDYERRAAMPSVKDIHYTAPLQPRQVRLDTIADCPASCVFCSGFSRVEGRRRSGVQMPFALIEQVVNEIATWPQPLYEVIPVNYGEFWLRKDWYDILHLFETRLPLTQIWSPSNGAALTPENVERLCSVRTFRGINFSVNAHFKESYKRIMDLPEWVILRVQDAIQQIRRLRPDITIWVSLVYNPAYMTELEKELFRDFWTAQGVTVQLNSMSAMNFSWVKPLEEPVTLPCRSIFSDMVIMYDGRVASCCWDSEGDINLGNIKGSTLLAQWNGERFKNFRDLHNQGERAKVALCRTCTFA